MDDAGRDPHGGVHIDKAIDPASGERLFFRQGWARDEWTRTKAALSN